MKRTNFVTVRLRDVIKNELGIDTKALVPANFCESGMPFPEDRDSAIALGRHSVQLVSRGVTGRMASLKRSGRRLVVTDVPLAAAVKRERLLDSTYFDFAKYRPKKKFFDYVSLAFPRGYTQRDAAYLKLLRRLPLTK